jgi:hypothetical protein
MEPCYGTMIGYIIFSKINTKELSEPIWNSNRNAPRVPSQTVDLDHYNNIATIDF